MNYLIFDSETPNRRNNSICACAWILHDGSRELDSGSQLINPKADFNSKNTDLHGICADDVCDAPTISEYWRSTLADLFAHAIIVAHNASSDLSFVRKALGNEGLEMPPVKCIDTMKVFRSLLRGESLRLCDIAARYHYNYREHDAGEDVRALKFVLDSCMQENGFPDYDTMFKAASVQAITYQPVEEQSRHKHSYQKSVAPQGNSRANVEAVLAEARSKNVDFSDVHFSFHGELQNPAISRINGLDEIVEALGGVFHKSVGKKVDYYVCFDNNCEAKTVEKAHTIKEDPASNLQIIYTQEFFDLLGYGTDTPNHDGPRMIRERKQAERAAAEASKHATKKRDKALPDSPVFGGYTYESVYNAIQQMIGVDEQNVSLKKNLTTVSIIMFGGTAFNIIINGQSQYIKTAAKAALDYSNQIGCAEVKRDALFVPLSCGVEDRNAVADMVNAVYRSKKESAAYVEFGCCNDFIRCSDAKKCLKESDPFYLGCQYRKNLEAGRIFYGKNRNHSDPVTANTQDNGGTT